MKMSGNKSAVAVIWNIIGSGLSAGQAAILLVFISRKYGTGEAGILTIAYAIGNLFLTAGKYGVRNFQATDNSGKVSFQNYLKGRILSVSAALFIAVLFLSFFYMGGRYDSHKCQIIFLIVVLKETDALEDVFLGRLQQAGHFGTGARIMALRQMAVTALICIGIICRDSIQASLLSGIAVSLLTGICMLASEKELIWEKAEERKNTDSISYLMRKCFPLFLGSTLAMYVGNMPKYITDLYMDGDTQAILGYIMLPVFMVTLASQFIYQPFVKELGDLWDTGLIPKFKSRVKKQAIFILATALIVLLVSLWAGLPLLSLIYHMNLNGYYSEFTIILAGGSLYALAAYLNIPLTILGKQNMIAAGYGGAAAFALTFGRMICQKGGLTGAALLYMTVNAGLVIMFGFTVRNEAGKEC